MCARFVASRHEGGAGISNASKSIDHVVSVAEPRRIAGWADDDESVVGKLAIRPLRVSCKQPLLGIGSVADDDVNVAPLEVEQVLLQHPDIVQAYVVGVPDRSKGEIVAAAVELRGGAATDPAAIVAFCRERLASYKVPARLAFRAAAQLPRTPTGKIHKPSLVEQLAANSATWHGCKTRTA